MANEFARIYDAVWAGPTYSAKRINATMRLVKTKLQMFVQFGKDRMQAVQRDEMLVGEQYRILNPEDPIEKWEII